MSIHTYHVSHPPFPTPFSQIPSPFPPRSFSSSDRKCPASDSFAATAEWITGLFKIYYNTYSTPHFYCSVPPQSYLNLGSFTEDTAKGVKAHLVITKG